MANSVNPICVIIIKEGCEACKKLLKNQTFNRCKWLLRYIPILDLEFVKKTAPEIIKIAKELNIDVHGFLDETIDTPILVCPEYKFKMTLDFEDDVDLRKKLELIRFILSYHVTTRGQPKFKQVGVVARELSESGQQRSRGRRRRVEERVG